MIFANQIKRTRELLHMTQAELAGKLAVETQTVSNWECGRTTPWPKAQVDILSRLLTLQQGPQPRGRVCELI